MTEVSTSWSRTVDGKKGDEQSCGNVIVGLKVSFLPRQTDAEAELDSCPSHTSG